MISTTPTVANIPMAIMASTTPTQYFNDSCGTAELRYAIERGAIGATSNPVICLGVLRAESDRWMPRILEIVAAHPHAHERSVAWQLYTEMGVAGAELLRPVFDAHGRQWGRLSLQTDPTLHNDAAAMLAQARTIVGLAPNMQVKTPATAAGISMIEEATFGGVNLNVTVSFSVPQVLAIADAIERGLCRRDDAGLDNSHMTPVATMMIGRLDDWLRVVSEKDSIDVSQEAFDWPGIACAKRAYVLLGERQYRTKLLVAAYRHLGHWTELIGGDLCLTMPAEWQIKANASGHVPQSRIDRPVEASTLRELSRIPDFVRAYEPNGMTLPEFSTFGPTLRTLRSFIAAWYDFVGIVRDVMLPDPDRQCVGPDG